MELSVRPGKCFAISAHLFPWILWSVKMILSSSLVHRDLLMAGSRWLCHLSLHCFPDRPRSWKRSLRLCATIVHCLIPNSATRVHIASSSFFSHDLLFDILICQRYEMKVKTRGFIKTYYTFRVVTYKLILYRIQIWRWTDQEFRCARLNQNGVWSRLFFLTNISMELCI